MRCDVAIDATTLQWNVATRLRWMRQGCIGCACWMESGMRGCFCLLAGYKVALDLCMRLLDMMHSGAQCCDEHTIVLTLLKQSSVHYLIVASYWVFHANDSELIQVDFS